METIKEYCKTSTKTSSIYQDDFFWQQLVQRDFNNCSKKLCSTWHDTYKMLNTPVYETIAITQYGYEEPDIDSEIFWDQEIALSHLVDKVLESYCYCDCLDDVVTVDLSTKFQQILCDSCLEDLESKSNHCSDDYLLYIQRYRDILKDKFVTQGRIGCEDPHMEFKFIRKNVK